MSRRAGVSLLVMIPAFNEERSIADVIAAIPADIDGVGRLDVVVVDDGSTDSTVERARAAGADVVSHGRRRGVGAAIQTGLAEARRRRADLAVNIDADGQFDPREIRRLVRPILDGQADFVTASRFVDPSLVPRMPWVKRMGNHGMSALVSRLAGERFADVSCGFRAYSREAILRLTLHGQFTYTQESFLVLSFKGLRILEVAMPVRGTREHGKSKVASNLFRYALRTSAILYRCFRDYRPEALFNGIVAVMVSLSLGFGGFFLGHRFLVGTFTPHIWAGFVGAFCFVLAIGTFFIGQIASMVNRVRMLEEEQLYLLRRQEGRIDADAAG